MCGETLLPALREALFLVLRREPSDESPREAAVGLGTACEGDVPKFGGVFRCGFRPFDPADHQQELAGTRRVQARAQASLEEEALCEIRVHFPSQQGAYQRWGNASPLFKNETR